ncbi:MAG TPA: hypothetical protein VN929_11295 [Burkholderiales bacterium]|nr:hypothetical protein [Burkholderiales bacterium]
MIPMTADEIKEYWHDYCNRHGIDEAVRARGDAQIDNDPEYWADQTMGHLLDAIAQPKS